MSAVLLLHHLRKKRWQQQEEEEEGEEKEPPHRHQLKMDTVPSDSPGPSRKRNRTQDASAEVPKRTVVHQLFDTSTSVMYTIHETADEETFKNTNGISGLNSLSDGFTVTTTVPSTNNCLPPSKIRQPVSAARMINRTPVGLNDQLCGVNQLHNKKIQTTIKPKVRTVGIQVAFGEKKLLASQETQTDWTFQPPFPVQDRSCSVQTEIINAV